VDPVDLDIFRWMFPGGVWTPWGIDPRITNAEIARHIGLSRKAVWERVRGWKSSGFLEGYIASPNISLFGVDLLRVEIHVADAVEGSALLDEVGLIDGVLDAGLAFGDSTTSRDVEILGLTMVGDSPIEVDRRMRVLRRLSSTGMVNGPFRDEAPPRTMTPTPLDWRIIGAIVADPEAPLSRIARSVGVSLKTTDRRRSALLDGRALLYFPQLAWRMLPSVDLTVFCRGPGDVPRVRSALELRFPHQTPLEAPGAGYLGPEFAASPFIGVRLPADSPGQIQDLVVKVSKIPGVRLVRPQINGLFRAFPRWVEERLAERVAASRTRRGPGP